MGGEGIRKGFLEVVSLELSVSISFNTQKDHGAMHFLQRGETPVPGELVGSLTWAENPTGFPLPRTTRCLTTCDILL